MKRLLCLCLMLMSHSARAHGTVPTSNAIAFGPGVGGLLLGTNFGALLLSPDGEQRFICELAVTGEQQALDNWLWLSSGEVLGVVTRGGLLRGVFASGADACGYGTVSGTEPFLITELVQDTVAGSVAYAVGYDDARVVLMRLPAGDSATVIHEDASLPLPVPSSVRAAAGHVYAVFASETRATIVHHDGSAVTLHPHALATGESLRVLGISPADPHTLWLTRGTATGDVLLKSDDAGDTLVPVHTVDARLGGFAIDGDVVWVQSARAGVHRSEDGGLSFSELPASPHGTCLALASDGRLFACGVPWQDGFALGVSDDGKRFGPVLPFFDGVVGAIDCPATPATTTTCEAELDFLRGYYGFSDPAVVEAGPVEAGEAAPEAVEATELAIAEQPQPSSDGCAGAAAGPWLAWLALYLLRLAARSRNAW